MCTVSYLPTRDGYLLTSNRDEDPGRETRNPELITLENGLKVLAPRDERKGGTWMAMDELGRTVCLLNGAFGKHQRLPEYRRSRGLIVLESLAATDFDSFTRDCELIGVEPFTLLLVHPERIIKLLWDGIRKYSWVLPGDQVQLWSSPTLYDPVQHARKERYFKDSLKEATFESQELLRIHGSKERTPFVLDRSGVKTVSITQATYLPEQSSLYYYLKNSPDEEAVFISRLTA